MRFDFIIGNPPYQEEQEGDNKTFAPPIYHKFMEAVYPLADHVVLITPARFLFDAGSTPKDWNRKMLSDPHLKVLWYEADGKKIFPGTDIKGGVAVTYRDATKYFGAIDTFVPFEELKSIIAKVLNNKASSFSSIVYSRTEYRLTDVMHQDFPNAIHQLSNGHPYDMATNIFESLPEIFFDIAPQDGHTYVGIYGLLNMKRTLKYIRKDYVNEVENLGSFKVFVPKSNGSGALGEALSTPLIGAPLIGHTESFVSIGNFQTENEAENCMKYIKTKLARCLLGVLKVTQDNPPEKWRYVPLQDFSEASDIDWQKSVAQIDCQLYSKYGLDEEEIHFIESHVKEMA